MYNVIVVLYFIWTSTVSSENSECLRFEPQKGKIVCVCNATHCDYFDPQPIKGKVNVFTSSESGKRYSFKVLDFETTTTTDAHIQINRKLKYQKIYGFGGAMTDATVININSLSNETGNHLMRSYFTTNGSTYTFCRVPIGGTDFSTHGYSYNDGPEDPELKNFKLASEDNGKIALLKKAKNLSARPGKFKFFASTWTAPAWMKTNGAYKGGKIKPEFYQTWANYHLKFLEAYQERDIDFWGISTGNEPSLVYLPLNPINSVGWSSDELSLYIRKHLGPTIKKSKFSKTKILTIDDQISFYQQFLTNLMQDNVTRSYVDGFSLHWYLNFLYSPLILSKVIENYPEKFIISGEASSGYLHYLPWVKSVDFGSWQRGEDYAADIIEDVNNFVSAWIDWNLALDTTGGPSYVKNNVDSAILVNIQSDEFYKQPMYYAIGHFSKFLPEGSIRINHTTTLDIDITAFLTPSPANYTVIILLNRFMKDIRVPITDGKNNFTLELEAKSITTVVY